MRKEKYPRSQEHLALELERRLLAYQEAAKPSHKQFELNALRLFMRDASEALDAASELQEGRQNALQILTNAADPCRTAFIGNEFLYRGSAQKSTCCLAEFIAFDRFFDDFQTRLKAKKIPMTEELAVDLVKAAILYGHPIREVAHLSSRIIKFQPDLAKPIWQVIKNAMQYTLGSEQGNDFVRIHAFEIGGYLAENSPKTVDKDILSFVVQQTLAPFFNPPIATNKIDVGDQLPHLRKIVAQNLDAAEVFITEIDSYEEKAIDAMFKSPGALTAVELVRKLVCEEVAKKPPENKYVKGLRAASEYIRVLHSQMPSTPDPQVRWPLPGSQP